MLGKEVLLCSQLLWPEMCCLEFYLVMIGLILLYMIQKSSL